MNLYAELNVHPSSTTQEIKRAYKTLALKYHPDKLSTDLSDKEREAAIEKFKLISKSYNILSDANKRHRYDTTGSIDEKQLDDLKGDVTWEDYFKALWKEVTEESIKEYEKVYKYSEEERKDVLNAYISTQGCLLSMIEAVPYSELDDINRFREICQSAIDQGEVQEFKKFPHVNAKSLARKRKELAKEAKEVESNEQDLAALIQARQKDRLENMIQGLEEKYKPASPKKRRLAKRK